MEISRDTSATVLALLAAALLCTATAEARQPRLPDEVPVPKVFSPPAGNVPPAKLGDTPLPEPRPDPDEGQTGNVAKPVGDAQPPDKAPVPAENPEHLDEAKSKSDAPASGAKPDAEPATQGDEQVMPETAPLPQESPAKPEEPAGNGKAPDPAEAGKTAQPTDPRSNAPRPAAMPAEEIACRARLDALGVRFEERKPESDASGCALPWPIAVKTLGRTIDIAPDALMDCAMAEAAARFAVDVISPAAKAAYGEDLKSVSQASGYVCRPRNGTTKLSEHAFGNALDIARFTLSKGTEIDVEPAPDEKAAKFLADIRKAACGPFKTVLGPGSDADHARHFHLDLAPRKHGGTFCQ
jgi:hypothetical protein